VAETRDNKDAASKELRIFINIFLSFGLANELRLLSHSQLAIEQKAYRLLKFLDEMPIIVIFTVQVLSAINIASDRCMTKNGRTKSFRSN